ncbi:uncharacterized protein LOC130781856 [Actinidia eriantha]|uniref:uncharacterized protein LOC130781856 n=1 Tax=Actinidia eriantha TaxID=165200 RepID=UPI0025887D03|nr:uncharacterized protein LOC130781856 [Actinidia eriantha]XP_057497209.1 uncharacterized protein LOC130781856 [Actinidia eriantha]
MIEYAQTPETRFFLCRQCRAHIALTQNYLSMDSVIGAGIFSNAVNVHVGNDPTHYRMYGIRTVADAYCDRCNMFLGWKQLVEPDIGIIVQPGRLILFLNKLLLWDGIRIVYATNTQTPVDNDSSGSSEGSNDMS